eukprot:TRINITY_DN2954_c3_g1_i1.p1 TRINITY_DN2954_c3_g1~~TRINITY_DN2954_c3_g1_i1.p1  ORF type:complete len:640 (+),score=73.40 TRINITY_DN2954_c3_g1_i1:42-1922(+)
MTVNIFAVNTVDGCEAVVTAEASWGVDEMHNAIRNSLGLEDGAFEMLFEGEILTGGGSVESWGIAEGNTVEVVLSRRHKAIMELEEMGAVPVTHHTMVNHEYPLTEDTLIPYLQLWFDAIPVSSWAPAAETLVSRVSGSASEPFNSAYYLNLVQYIEEKKVDLTPYVKIFAKRPSLEIFSYIVSRAAMTNSVCRRILVMMSDVPLEYIEVVSPYVDVSAAIEDVQFMDEPAYMKGQFTEAHALLFYGLPVESLRIVLKRGRNFDIVKRMKLSLPVFTLRCIRSLENLEGYLKLFQEFGCDILEADERGNTALMYLLMHGQYPSPPSMLITKEACAKLNKRRRSALTFAVRCPATRLATVNLLLEHSDPSIKDDQGNTLIHLARQPSFVGRLHETGRVDINASNYHGVTALKQFVRSHNEAMVDALLRCGANPRGMLEFCTKTCSSKAVFYRLANAMEDIGEPCVKDQHYMRGLIVSAIQHGASAIYRGIICRGYSLPNDPADLTIEEMAIIVSYPKTSTTSKYLSRRSSRIPPFLSILPRLPYLAVVFIHHYYRQFITIRDSFSQTALMYMVQGLPLSSIELFFSTVSTDIHKTYIMTQNRNGETAIDIARRLHRNDVVAVLKKLL